ncbi:MAG: TetR/AcrR family transcriptional regulator [Chitinophagaceae bacterium]
MKNEILQTSLQQFLKHGIRKMSVQKLVAPLGISTKTVYKYFKNKEDLLEQGLQLFHAQQYEMLQNQLANQHAATLFFDIWYKSFELEYKVNQVFFHDLRYYYPELENKIEATVAKKFKLHFARIVQKGIDEGSFQKTIHPEIILEVVYVLYASIIREGRFKRFRMSAFDILFNTIGKYIRGICTDSGISELDAHMKKVKQSGLVMLSTKAQ